MARQKQPDIPWTPDREIPDTQHEMFSQAYVADFNATKAYKTVYKITDEDKTVAVWANASRLIRHDRVGARIKYLLSLRRAAFESNQGTIKELTVNVLRSSPLDYMTVTEDDEGKQSGRILDPSVIQNRHLISELDISDGKTKIKLMNKDRALEHMLRIEKLLVDKHELSGELMVRQSLEADEAYRRRVEKVTKAGKKR